MNWTYLHISLRTLLVIAITVITIVSFYFIFQVTYPFVIGLLLALSINPIVNFFESKGRMPRALSVFITLILFIAVFAGIITLLIIEIVAGTEYLAKVVPGHFETLVLHIETIILTQIIPFFSQITTMFHSLEETQQQSIWANVENLSGTIGTNVAQFIQLFLQNLPKMFTWIPNVATVLIFSVLATFFISKDWYRLRNRLYQFIPTKVQLSVGKVFVSLKKAFVGFIRAQATLISITAVIVLIGLLILRVEYAITIALIIGIVDLLPYLGTGLIFVPWIIYLIISGNIGLAIGLSVLYVIVLVQRQLMEPKVLSSNIGLDPLATLIALFVGFKLIGFLGLIVGPVTLVILNTMHKADVFKDIWNYIINGKQAKI